MAVERKHKRRSVAVAAGVLATIALVIAGYVASRGSAHKTGTTADPASVVPASAPLYAGATVRPNEPLRGAARAAGRGLTHKADPYLRLLGVLQAPGSAPLDYQRDVEPWLGTGAGIFLVSLGAAQEANAARLLSLVAQSLLGGSSSAIAFPFGTDGVQGAIVLDTSDAAKALAFMNSEAARDGARATSYRGVEYRAGADDVAFGVVDRFAVLGSESGLRSVIDTSLGGPSLAHASAYSQLLAHAPAGALAHLYASSSATAGARVTQGLAGLAQQLLAGERATNISLVPSTGSIAVDADGLVPASAGTASGLFSSSEQGAQALDELPGESWLAVGLGDLNATLGADAASLRGLASLPSELSGPSPALQASGGITVKGLLEGILAPLGILGQQSAEARRDFQSWMGAGGIFASGNGLLELKGGVAINSDDPARSRAAVGELAAKLRAAGNTIGPVSIPGTEASVMATVTGLPVALDIAAGHAANGQAKFVIGIGEASVTAALNPPNTMSGAQSRAAAASTLGEGIQPSLIVAFPTLLGLLEGVGLLQDPTISPFVPYLRSLSTLVGGGKSLGSGIERLRLVATLPEGG